jgi:hypothetical protein
MKKYVLISIYFLAAVGLNAGFFLTGGRSLWIFIPQAATTLWFLYQFYHFLGDVVKTVKKTRIYKKIKSLFLHIFGEVRKKTARLLSKIPRRKNKLFINAYKEERTFIIFEKKYNDAHLRKMRWRGLTENRARVRYVYITYIARKIKERRPVDVSDTPNELYARFNEHEPLFPLYNRARYGEEAVYDDEVTTILSVASKRLRV